MSLWERFLDLFTFLRCRQTLGVNILFFRILVTLLTNGVLNAIVCHKVPAVSWRIPTISILGDLKIILNGLGDQFGAEHGAAEPAGGRFPPF